MIKGAVMNEHKKHGSSFSSKMGFILAAAGSAVGLGNLWRFPYLAAKYGGGSFLLIYVILAVTFGFALMITEIALGRKPGKVHCMHSARCMKSAVSLEFLPALCRLSFFRITV